MVRIVLITPRLQHYRLSFYEKLAQTDNYELEVYYGVSTREDGKAGYNGQTKFASVGFTEIKYRVLPFEVVYNPGMLERIKSTDPDIIIMLASTGNISYRRIISWARNKAKKVIIWTSGWDPGRAKGPLLSFKNSLVSAFYRKADHFLTYSTFASHYVESMGVPKSRITICYNGIETDELLHNSARIISDSQSIIRIHNLKGFITFLFVGGLIPEKRVDLLIEAFIRLRRKYENIKLMMIGDGPMKKMVEDILRRQNDRNIIYLGRIIQGVDHYFAAADCLVLPGAGGLALNQAMFWNKVCIVSKADGTEDDLVIENLTGYRFRENDLESLVNAMERRINDSTEKVKLMSENSSRMIMSKSNVNNMVRIFRGAIDGLSSQIQESTYLKAAYAFNKHRPLINEHSTV